MVRNWWIGTKDAPCVPTHLRLFSSGFLNQRHIYLWKELFCFFWKLLIQILKFGWCITNIDINLVYNLTNILVKYAGRHVSVTFLIKIFLQKLLYIPYIKSFVLEKWCLLLSDTKCYCYPIHKTYFLASNPKYNYIFKHNLSLKKHHNNRMKGWWLQLEEVYWMDNQNQTMLQREGFNVILSSSTLDKGLAALKLAITSKHSL